MSDSSSNNRNKKISGVQSTDSAKRIGSLEGIDSVDRVKATTAVSGVGQIGAVRKSQGTRIMSAAERDQMFSLIQEEADKLLKDMPEERKKVVADAVKMAIDVGSLDE